MNVIYWRLPFGYDWFGFGGGCHYFMLLLWLMAIAMVYGDCNNKCQKQKQPQTQHNRYWIRMWLDLIGWELQMHPKMEMHCNQMQFNFVNNKLISNWVCMQLQCISILGCICNACTLNKCQKNRNWNHLRFHFHIEWRMAADNHHTMYVFVFVLFCVFGFSMVDDMHLCANLHGNGTRDDSIFNIIICILYI